MAVSLQPDLSRLSARVAETTGLHFPPERWDDLRRGLMAATAEFGFAGEADCADWLVSASLTRAQIHALASHLTVGETYFFRDRKTFAVLAEQVLPDLIRARRGGERRLRIWSAACCTGEEPYSLAILLRQLLPDWEEWRITILATDINERFLQRAVAGIYGEWSFRETPASFKDRYFHRTPEGRYAIAEEFKQRVTFAPLNLVEDVFPSLATDTNALDLIFCRNVLMYFTPAQGRKVSGGLSRALVDDGWLVVSATEGSPALLPDFAPVNFPGAILYRKGAARNPAIPACPPPWAEPPVWAAPAMAPVEPPPLTPLAEERLPSAAAPDPLPGAAELYRQGRYVEAAEILAASRPGSTEQPKAYSLLAHALANQGRLREALEWCERWVAADKLEPASHYLRAVIALELGDRDLARRSHQRALYLQPDFVLAHFALGNLDRAGGRHREAQRHFANALDLLGRHAPDEGLPASDGLTAGRLTEIIRTLLAMEATS